MFKALGLSVRAFLSNPLKFIGDPSNAVIEQRTKELVEEGKTIVEIEEELTAAGLKKGAGPVKVIVDGIGKTVQFFLDNLPRILLVAALLFVTWYVLKAAKVVKAVA